MKKLMFIAAFLILTAASYAQALQKGNLIGFHNYNVTLDPNVTMNQYLDFFVNKVIPEFDKNFTGGKMLIAKGLRGEYENGYGVIYFMPSESIRDKFFKADGSFTEAGQAAYDKMKTVLDQLDKLGKATSKYTDWLVL